MNVPVTVSASAAGPDDEWTAVVVRKVEPVAAARLHGSLGQRVVPDLLQQRILRFFRILRLFRLRSSCVRILRIRVFRIRLFRFAQAYGYLDPGDGVGGRVEDVRIVAAGRECGCEKQRCQYFQFSHSPYYR